MFRAIFAESSDESAVSSNESDVESTVVSGRGNPSNANKSNSTHQNRNQWQDLSTVTSLSMNTEKTRIVVSSPPTLNQDNDNRKPPDQPLESYGPSLPPSKHCKININIDLLIIFIVEVIDQQEYTGQSSPERRHRHHHTKRSHKKKERKMVSFIL